MIALLIRLFSIFGHSEFAVRLTSLTTTIITVIMLYKLSKRMFNQRVADITLLLACASPLINAVFFITTPDSPLLMFWAITLFCFYVGIFESNTKYIYLSGFFAGCALLSKYTAVLIFPPLLIFLLLSANYRKYLLKKELYFAVILAFMVFSPVIYWNYQHDWVSFKFQFHHGVNPQDGLNFGSLGDYLGGQVLIGGLFIFLPIVFFSIKYFKINIRDDKLAFLFWPFVFVFCFFGYRSLFQHMEANWPAPIYISAIIWLAYWLNRINNRWIYKTAICFMLIFIVILKFPLEFTPKRLHNAGVIQIVNAFYGSRELLEQVKPYITRDDILLACDYGNASRAWFYLGIRAYVLNDFLFSHNYQYWNGALLKPIKSAIYICDGEDNTALDFLKIDFKQVNLLNTVDFDNVVGSKHMYIFKALN